MVDFYSVSVFKNLQNIDKIKAFFILIPAVETTKLLLKSPLYDHLNEATSHWTKHSLINQLSYV